jgi:hypothetical protein
MASDEPMTLNEVQLRLGVPQHVLIGIVRRLRAVDVVETALAKALVLAAEAKQWDVVAQIADELRRRGALRRAGRLSAAQALVEDVKWQRPRLAALIPGSSSRRNLRSRYGSSSAHEQPDDDVRVKRFHDRLRLRRSRDPCPAS